MHLVITENKLLVDLPKKVRMEHQNVFAHAESYYSLIAGKIRVGFHLQLCLEVCPHAGLYTTFHKHTLLLSMGHRPFLG